MIKIKKVTPFREPTKVYDIEVDQNHNYFANGLLVSNSHITLFESIPNPTFVGTRGKPGPVMLLTGLNHKEFENIINCKTQVNGKTGGEAIKDMLSKIDVKKELKETLEKLPKLRATELDRANRKAKHLLALDKAGIKPVDAYMMKHVPVIPPIFRPITALEDGSISPADINTLYLRLIQDSNKLKTMDKSIPDEEKNKLRAGLYDKLKSVVGLGSTPTYDQNKKLKGIMQTIAGENPKEGFFQDKLVKRRQELSMRSTITPAQDIGIDQVGLPKEAAMDLYKPFVVKELVTTGINQLEALRHIKDKTPLAWRALEKAAEKRPVLLKRDPVLHKYNIQAFFPKLVEGNSIKIHPLICSGTNADFDGDSTIGEVIIVTSENLWYNIDMPHSNQPILSSNIIDIKDFPRLDSTKIIKSNGVEEYDVPNGVFVPSLSNNEMNWAPVTKFSIHPNCEEWITKTRLGRELISSADHSLATFDLETLEVVQTRPSESVSRCIPIFRGIQKTHLLEELPGEPSNRSINNQKNINKMIDKIPLNWDIGWFIGATIGDGWVIHWNNKSQGISLATGDNQVDLRNKWVEVSDFLCGAKQYSITQPHKFEGIDCSSTTTRIRSAQVGRWMERLIGSGAQNKHLPPNFLATPLEFRMGLFCGLIDTDGTCCWTNKPQFTLTYHTISKTLANEVILLCNSLGLIASITEYTNRDKPAYIITISIRCAQEATWIKFVRQDKMQAIIKLWNMDNVDYGRDDIVPLPPRVQTELLLLMKNLGASLRINKNKEAASQYTILLKRNPVITRQSVERLGKLIDGKEISPFLMKWFSIALNKNIGWDLILESKPSGEYKTMYDITVPDSWTFTMANGAVVWDTMAAYLPVTEEARREAIEKMLPSKNLFSSTHYGVMHTPDQEAVMGLYYLSRWGQKKDKQYKSSQDILNDKSLHINDVVQLNGKDTTLGRQLIVQKLPEEFKTEELQHDPNFKLKKRWLYGFLEKVAHKDGKAYPEIVNHFKDIGNKYAYEEGLTFGLKDLKPLKEAREKILKPYHEQAEQIWNNKALSKEEQERQVVKVYTEATNKLDEELHPEFKKLNNMIYTTAIEVGGKGSKASFRQMNIAPMLLVDATNRIVPSPVTHSYSEGLNVAEYWTALHGARKGTLQKVEGTQEPGKITKEIVNLNINTLVTHPDCGTKEGIKLPVDEVDVVERYTSHPIHVNGRTIPANTHITPELVGELKKFGHKDIMVRSSLTCKDHDGICQRCLGHSSEGRPHEIGTNIGVTASQALGEPLIQMTLDCIDKDAILTIFRSREEKVTFEELWNLVKDEVQVSEIGGEIIETKNVSHIRVKTSATEKLVYDDRTPIYKIQRHKSNNMIKITTSIGKSLICKATHPSLYMDGSKISICPAKDLLNKIIILENDVYDFVTNIEKSDYNDWTYDLSTRSKTYNVNEICTHNSFHCNHAESLIFYKKDEPSIYSLKDLWKKIKGPVHKEGNIEYKEIADGKVWDGSWTKVKRITRHKPSSKMLIIGNDYFLGISQDTHPLVIKEKGKIEGKDVIFDDCLVNNIDPFFEVKELNKKSIQINFINYDNESLKEILNQYIKDKKCETTSFLLIQQLIFICNKLNIFYKLNVKKERRTIYQIKLVEKSRKLEQITIKTELPYKGYVYDLTTESGQFICSGILVSNSGGTAASRGGASVSRVERVNQLLNMPKTIPGSATLSEVDGVISKIEKDEATNGHHIWVGDKKHFVPQGAYMMEHIKPGHKIEKGEAFNYGPINPHDLLKHKGIEGVREQLVNDLYNGLYKDEHVRRRNIEVVAKNLTNLSRVKDGGNSHFLTGDYVPTTELLKHNEMVKDPEHKIKYTPVLKGAQFGSEFKSEDLLDRLNFQRLQQHLMHAAQTGVGWKIHGNNPIPNLAMGTISRTPGKSNY